MNIDSAVRIFANFLNNSSNTILPLLKDRDYTTDESSKYDWLQANWELLVERKVLNDNEYLEIYAIGADFNGSSSRITDYNKLPTHKVVLVVDKENDILNDELIEKKEFAFDELVGFKDGFYSKEPPFNFALVFDDSMNKERVFNIEFKCNPIKTAPASTSL
jgi:hypothetical protein